MHLVFMSFEFKSFFNWYVVMGTIMLDHKMGGMLDHDQIEENL